MGLSGRITADFSSFAQALDHVKVKLGEIPVVNAQVQKSFDTTLKSFSGVSIQRQADTMAKAIQNVGGAAKLTSAEQDKANAVFTAAAAKMDKLGPSFASAAAEYRKLAEATVSVEHAQRLAAEQAAVTAKRHQDNIRALSTAGMALTAGVTVPLAAMGAASLKAALSFESSFAGVRKTVDATEAEFAKLSAGFRTMAKEIPVSVNELNKIGEAAGQLGIRKENILSFTRVIADLGVTTDLASDQAATALAQFANITQMSQEDFGRLGSTIVALGNNFATTEAAIVEMGLRLAGAGAQVGMSEGQILALATALSSVGIEAEAGGSALSKVMVNMALAVQTGGDALKNFATVVDQTDVSGAKFKQLFETDAAGAINAFVVGLGRIKESGGSVVKVLDDMGITEVRMRDALLRTAGAGDALTKALDLQNIAWDENAALTKEAGERYKTGESQIRILKGQINDLFIELGNNLLPVLKDVLEGVMPLVEKASEMATQFGALPSPVKNTAIAIAGLGIVVGPVAIGVARLATALDTLAASKAFLVLSGIATGTVAATGAVATFGAAVGAVFTDQIMKAVMNGRSLNEIQADFAKVLGQSGGVLDQTSGGLLRFSETVNVVAQGATQAGNSTRQFTEAQKEQAKAAAEIAAALVPLTAAQQAAVLQWNASNISLDLMAKRLGISATAIKTFLRAAEDGKKAVEAMAKADERLAGGGLPDLLRLFPQLNPPVKTFAEHVAEAGGQVNLLASRDLSRILTQGPKVVGMTREMGAATKGWSESLSTLADTLQSNAGPLSAFGRSIEVANNAMKVIGDSGKAMGDKVMAGFSAAAEVVNQYAAGTALAALASGAAMGASAAAMIAGFASAGAAATAWAAGVGAAVGAVVGYVMYVSQKAAAMRQANVEATESIEEMRKALVDTYGSAAAVFAISEAVGVSLGGEWGHQGKEGLKAFTAVVEQFNKRQAELFKQVETGAGLASQELLDLLAVYQLFPEAAEQANAFISAQLEAAAGGINALVGGLEQADGAFLMTAAQAQGLQAATVAAFSEMVARGATVPEALDTVAVSIDSLKIGLEESGLKGTEAFGALGEMARIAGDEKMAPLANALAGTQTALSGLHNAGMLNQEMFSGLTMSATDAYNKIVGMGGDGRAALMMMAPSLQTIWELQQDFGYEVDAGTQKLLDQAEQAGMVGAAHQDAQERAAKAMEKVATIMEAIATKMGVVIPRQADLMAQGVIDAMGRVPSDIDIGVHWDLDDFPEPPGDASEFGEAIDEMTLAIQGWGDEAVGAYRRARDGAIDYGRAVPRGTPGVPTGTGGTRNDDGGTGSYATGGLVSRRHGGASVWAAGAEFAKALSFGGGGRVPAWLHEGEYVLRQSAVNRIGANVLDRVNRGAGVAAASAPINVTVNIDRPIVRDRQAIRELTDQIVREIPAALRRGSAV